MVLGSTATDGLGGSRGVHPSCLQDTPTHVHLISPKGSRSTCPASVAGTWAIQAGHGVVRKVRRKFALDKREVITPPGTDQASCCLTMCSRSASLLWRPVYLVGVKVSRRTVGDTKEVYADFICRATTNPEARAIKLADIEDHMDRLDQLQPDEAGGLAKRYERALEILRGEERDQ